MIKQSAETGLEGLGKAIENEFISGERQAKIAASLLTPELNTDLSSHTDLTPFFYPEIPGLSRDTRMNFSDLFSRKWNLETDNTKIEVTRKLLGRRVKVHTVSKESMSGTFTTLDIAYRRSRDERSRLLYSPHETAEVLFTSRDGTISSEWHTGGRRGTYQKSTRYNYPD